MEHDGRLHFGVTKGALRKGKPGQPAPGPKRLSLPILPELRAVLGATPSGHMSYLVNEWGKPFTAAGFGNKFATGAIRRACRTAQRTASGKRMRPWLLKTAQPPTN